MGNYNPHWSLSNTAKTMHKIIYIIEYYLPAFSIALYVIATIIVIPLFDCIEND